MHVDVLCPCYESPADKLVGDEEEEQRNLSDDLDVQSQRVLFATHPLSHLYFCTDCHAIRCPRCVVEEVVVTYCGQCLLECDKIGECARGCAQCPVCCTALSLTRHRSSKEFYTLQCLNCSWSSTSVGLISEKPTHVAKDWRARLESETWTMETMRAIQNGKQSMPMDESADALATKRAITTVSSDWMMRQSSYAHSSLLHNTLPIPASIKTKRSKRCRMCRKYLIRPDGRPKSVRLRTSLLALYFLPNLELSNADATTAFMKVTNPLKSHALRIRVATPHRNVIILAPEFTVGSFDSGTTTQQSLTDGIHARGSNWIQVMVKTSSGSWSGKIPLFLTVQHVVLPNSHEVEEIPDIGFWAVLET